MKVWTTPGCGVAAPPPMCAIGQVWPACGTERCTCDGKTVFGACSFSDTPFGPQDPMEYVDWRDPDAQVPSGACNPYGTLKSPVP